MFENGYIKLHRSLLSWEWYKNNNTKVLFLHCLLIANFEPARFEGVQVSAGSFVSSYPHLAEQTGLSIMEVRTAVKHLILTGELTVRKTPKFTVFTINNWGNFQELTGKLTGKQQAINSQLTGYQQSINNNIRNKEDKEEKEEKEKGSSIEQEEYHHEWDDLPCLTWEEAKKWELENGRRWDGLIE